MSREIKFRAWDERFSSMFECEQIIKASADSGMVSGYFDGSGCPKSENDSLMQYTGLKDKNGVKIFEGDVVKVTDSKSLWIVDFDAPSFIVQIVSGGITANLYSDLVYEVIGNIYENPELLKQ